MKRGLGGLGIFFLVLALVALLDTELRAVLRFIDARTLPRRGEEEGDAASLQWSGMTLTLERFGSHPLLAEFTRQLRITRADGREQVTELGNDPGGGSRVDVCEVEAGDLLLSDAFGRYRVTAEGKVQSLATAVVYQIMPDGSRRDIMVPDAVPMCRRVLGRFDTSWRRGIDFYPVSDR